MTNGYSNNQFHINFLLPFVCHPTGDGWSKDAFFEGQFTPKKAVGQINVFLFLERDEQAAKRASARVKAEKRKQEKRTFRDWKTESLLIVRDNRQITSKYVQPVPTTAYPELAFPPEVSIAYSHTLSICHGSMCLEHIL